jgi:tRNA pseudouridine55 synthase
MLLEQSPSRDQSQRRNSKCQSSAKIRWWERMVIASAILLQFSRNAQAFSPSRASATGTWGRLMSTTVHLRPLTYLHSSSESTTDTPDATEPDAAEPVATKPVAPEPVAAEEVKEPLCRSEGLFHVAKPMDWTSSNVVSYIRGILERDARQRGADVAKVGRKNKSKQIKVGHGGTLDPLATGVLVIGVGKGTKQLQGYLTGAKKYRAGVELGFETSTLDMEGNITKTEPFNHVTLEVLEKALPKFEGKISQIPPIFSAIRVDGKRLYQHARKGATTDDIVIQPREVEIYRCELVDPKASDLPRFTIDADCGGG